MTLYGEFYAFALGATASWVVTYLSCTGEKRIINGIKRQITSLWTEHGLSYHEMSSLCEALHEKEIWNARAWAAEVVQTSRIKINIDTIAAEILICQNILGLTYVHGLRALMRTKRSKELRQNILDVVAEIQDDERFPIDNQKWNRFLLRHSGAESNQRQN